jgi:hypothetical protein
MNMHTLGLVMHAKCPVKFVDVALHHPVCV